MHRFSRRDFLRWAGGLAMASSVPFPTPAFSGLLDRFLSSHAKLTPAITPNEEFYVTSYRSPPSINVQRWELAIKGLVEKPLVLTYPQLLARPSVSEIVTLECVGNSVAGEAIGTALWEGRPLKDLLEEAGISSKVRDVVFRAADGYSDSISLDRVMVGDVLVAFKMNGVALPQGHGFPARIIVPGIYGMKNVQWLTEIELVEEDYQGYYQQKGWSDDATVKTMSRIDLPGHGETIRGHDYIVRGLAFAGTRGVRQVEISTDSGKGWNPVVLKPAISPALGSSGSTVGLFRPLAVIPWRSGPQMALVGCSRQWNKSPTRTVPLDCMRSPSRWKPRDQKKNGLAMARPAHSGREPSIRSLNLYWMEFA